VKRTAALLAVSLLGALATAALLSSPVTAKTGPGPPTPILPTTTTKPVTTTAAATTTTRPVTTTAKPVTTTAVRATTTGATTTSSSTVVTIPGGGAPPPSITTPPSTIPLTTHESNGHVSPVFAALGGLGLFALVAMLVGQWFLTRPSRQGGWTL
jgi:hypothetical protein